ncbi:MAG: AGE family epimerase/isomerase [Spirochaetes bacterium]|nr:AGE family epimerase/isomerase [Spirochaetota bacterium]
MEETERLYREIATHLKKNLIPFWYHTGRDHKNGGFLGAINHKNSPNLKAPKGLIHHSRILYAFARLYQEQKADKCQELAHCAFNFINQYMLDIQNQGFFWLVDHSGQPLIKDKYCEGQAKVLLALAAYYSIEGNNQILEQCSHLYQRLENKTFDQKYGGYFSFFSQDWQLKKERVKLFNTHLHLLEAYGELFKIYPNEELKKSIHCLITLIKERFYDHKSGAFSEKMTESWQSLSQEIWYGHTIETAWLIYHLASDTSYPHIEELKAWILQLLENVYQFGYKAGKIVHGKTAEGAINTQYIWWVQIESMIGFLTAFQLSKDNKYWEAVLSLWNFIKTSFIDNESGEWFWFPKGQKIDNQKVNEWKSCYHTIRFCLEIMKRLRKKNG